MTDRYGAGIYWLQTSEHRFRPDLRGDETADVAVVGAGFVGLWSAYHLLREDPSLRVVLLEGEEVGFGASGRNGGFAMTLLDMSLAHLRRNQGDEAARAAHEAVAESVEDVGATVAEHGIECEWVHGGLLVVATNGGQLDRVKSDLEAAEALGLKGFAHLDADEVRARVNSPTYVGGLYEEHCGVVHPAKLARGLADVVEGMGATICERTHVTGFDDEGDKIRLTTPRGSVTADQVVLATNAWAMHTQWFRRRTVPLYTYVVLTEPLTDAQWETVGWGNREGIEDKRNYVHYYRRTADGRILWGGSDGVIYFDGRISARHDSRESIRRRLQHTFRRTFPQLADVDFTHHWGGPVAMTATFLPEYGTLAEGRLHYGFGCNGHGVAPSHTGGKVLRDKVLGRTTPYTELCFVDPKKVAFPPEPLRWVGAELTRRALLHQDAQLDAGKGGGEMDPWLLRLMNKMG